MGEFVHGQMNIDQNRESWVGFVRVVKWSVAVCVITLGLMAIFLT